MKILKGVDAIDRQKWEKLLDKSKYSSPFQSPAFVNVINASSEFSSDVYAVESDGELKALCVIIFKKKKGMKSWFSKRIAYGGPLIGNIAPDELTAFLKAIESDQKKGATYLEFKNYFDYSSYKDQFLDAGWSYLPYVNVQIMLEGKDMAGLLAEIKPNRRREISYSEKEGAEVRMLASEEELSQLYEILKDFYSQINVALPHYDYFQGFFHSPLSKMFGVYHKGKIIGGSVCHFYPGKSIYTQYYCRKKDCNNRIYPTHLAIKAAMEFGLRHNLQAVDLMGAGMGDSYKGIRNYKKQFGAVDENGRYFKVLRPVLFHLRRIAVDNLGKLKKMTR